jgi:hypothetical protein
VPSERERAVAVRTNVRDLSVNVGAVLDAIGKLREDRHMDRLEATGSKRPWWPWPCWNRTSGRSHFSTEQRWSDAKARLTF